MEVKNEQLAQRAREQQGSLDKDRAVAVAVAALTTVGTGIKRYLLCWFLDNSYMLRLLSIPA